MKNYCSFYQDFTSEGWGKVYTSVYKNTQGISSAVFTACDQSCLCADQTALQHKSYNSNNLLFSNATILCRIGSTKDYVNELQGLWKLNRGTLSCMTWITEEVLESFTQLLFSLLQSHHKNSTSKNLKTYFEN